MPQTRVLIVEDNEPIRQMYALKFSAAGFDVLEAGNGQQGLDAAERHKPELILLDLRMPIMSGDEMLLKLRESDWGSRIRVMILTNISKSEAPQSLRYLHVDRYITKVHHTPAQIVEIAREVLC